MLGPVYSDEPECRRCQHAYITYESATPHGCRAFGFKSARPPSIVVLEASGQPCSGFEAKGNAPPKGKRP